MKTIKLISILALAIIFIASCTKTPPSGPEGPTILDTTGGDVGGNNGNGNGAGYGTLSVFLKYEPDCSEALRIDVFDGTFTYSETAYINDYHPFDVDCSYYGTADFSLPYGPYKVLVSQCPESELYDVGVYSDCELFTPQVSEGEYVNVAFYADAIGYDGIVTINVNGIDIQRTIKAYSSYPDNCFSSGSARFNIPAGRYFVRYGEYAYPYSNGEYMNFYYNCNVRQLYY